MLEVRIFQWTQRKVNMTVEPAIIKPAYRNAWEDWNNDVYGGGHDDMLEEINDMRSILARMLLHSKVTQLGLNEDEVSYWLVHIRGRIEEAYPELYSDD